MSKQELTVKRQPPATHNLTDPGADAVQQEIKGLAHPVTATQVAGALVPHHQDVAIVPALTWYEKVWHPGGYWEIVCHSYSAVVVIDSQIQRPIEVGIDDRMTV